MGDFYLIKANFLYLDFTSTIEKEIATNLIDKDRHVLVLEELEKNFIQLSYRFYFI